MLAVTAPAVLLAGLEKAVTLAGAARDPAFTFAAAVFAADTLALRGGGAARHGARLPIAAVRNAMRFFHRFQTSGAACSLARSVRAMLLAEAACVCKRAAAFSLAHLLAATAVP